MNLLTLVPAALLLVAGSATAQIPRSGEAAAELGSEAHPDFATADTDKDGLLSISELQAALPEVRIKDANADGFVNQSEAEQAVKDLVFETSGFTGGSSLVSEPEYGLLVSTLGGTASGDAASGARGGADGSAARTGGAGLGAQDVDSGESRAPDRDRIAPGRD